MNDKAQLPDTQSIKVKSVRLNRVGVCGVDFPIYIQPKTGEKALCYSKVEMYVSLKKHIKGINMCYDDQTEILTKDRGWITFDRLSDDDYVATLNIETNELEWQLPTGRHIDHYEGKMYSYKNRLVDLCVTPNHNLLVYNSKKGNLHLEQAQDLFGRAFRFKKDCKWIGENTPYIDLKCEVRGHKKKSQLHIKTEDFMVLLGYYLAEGCTAKAARGYSIQTIICQNEVQDLQKIQQILSSYGIKASIHPKGLKGHKICFVNKTLGTYFKALGKSPIRYIPTSIKSLSTNYLEILLKWYLKGDGSKSENAGCSVSKKLMDDLQEVCIKCGKSMNISQFVKKQGFHPGVTEYRGYILSKKLRPNSRPEGAKSANEHWVDYKGLIYCCEVPNHTLLVRKNGKAVWSGNSRLPRTLMKYRYTSFSRWTLWKFLYDLKKHSDTTDAYAEINFKYFAEKVAPVSKEPSVMAYDCTFIGHINAKNKYTFHMKVKVVGTSNCPCSKSISKYGAHGQRSEVTATVETKKKRTLWIEDLIKIIEKNVSCEIYPVLKRPDEKYVTEKAYENPMFVEDTARQVGGALEKCGALKWYKVKVDNYESIHTHNAVTYIERNLKSGKWRSASKGLRKV